MSHLISRRAQSRIVNHFASDTLKGAPEGFKPHPKPLHLDYGTPNEGFFPIKSIHVTVKQKPFEDQEPESVSESAKGKPVVIENRAADPSLIDIATGLQYSDVPGIPQLHKFTKDIIVRAHPPKYNDWETTVSCGAGEGLNKAIDVFLDEGDVVLLEEFTYTPILQAIQNAGAFPVPVRLDLEISSGNIDGIDFQYLSNLLDNWDELKPEFKGRKPKAFYTIASGQNPTGLTQSLNFRKKIYALAEKHDFVIIEDDPYGYLTLPPYKESELKTGPPLLELEDYLQNHLTPSVLVGHKKVIETIVTYSSLVTRFPSGTSQILVNNVIEQNFGGVDGWLGWILKLRSVYARRRNVLLFHLYESNAYKERYFDLIDPRAGMFVSVLVKFPKGTDVSEKLTLLQWKFRAYGVGVVSGLKMAVDPNFSLERGAFFRLTFAPAETDEEITEAAFRFTSAVNEFFQKGLQF
ncbi:hypothetical protein JCM33374_g738 [Metschnikowia sp. JCM 33374]|nr:hypothetical protein JCM33374_g738 [Metschnikowia sp. JCM 33374]